MSTQLPSHPSLENLRKQAKALLKSVRAGDDEEVARVRDRQPDFRWYFGGKDHRGSWPVRRPVGDRQGAPLRKLGQAERVRDHRSGALEQAIRDDDIAKVAEILKANPKLMKGEIPWQDCRGDRTLLWYATWRGSLSPCYSWRGHRECRREGWRLVRPGRETLGV